MKVELILILSKTFLNNLNPAPCRRYIYPAEFHWFPNFNTWFKMENINRI